MVTALLILTGVHEDDNKVSLISLWLPLQKSLFSIIPVVVFPLSGIIICINGLVELL